MANYRAVLFDIDDTLIDFKRSEKLSLEKVYAKFFSKKAEKEEFFNEYHLINQALWKQVEEGTMASKIVGSVRFQKLADLYQTPGSQKVASDYEDHLVDNSDWIYGAKPLLEALKRQGIMIGFISNGFARVQRGKYKSLELDNYSDVLVISEEIGCAKPDPKIFHFALDLLNTKSSETLMVGDSLSIDGVGARSVGMPFCWYNPLNAPAFKDWNPNYILRDLSRDSVSFLLEPNSEYER